MNTTALLPIGIVAAMASQLHAQTPTTIEYTGRVAVDGQNFTSTANKPGFFKCILVAPKMGGGGVDTIWSNDGMLNNEAGTSDSGSEPSGGGFPVSVPAAIRLTEGSDSAPFAVNGQFTLRLGVTDSEVLYPPPITPAVLTDSGGNVRPDVRLRVWFSPDNSSFELLSPDVQFGAVPFAVWAASAETVKDDAITPEKIAGNAAVPIGGVIAWAGAVDSLPEQFRRCDGSGLLRDDFRNLFAVIGTAYGPGDGSTTFNIPNLDNRFIRGAPPEAHAAVDLDNGGGSGVTGATSLTVDQMPGHGHGITDPRHNHNASSSPHRHGGATGSGKVATGVLRVVREAGTGSESNHIAGRGSGFVRDLPAGEVSFPGSNHNHPISNDTVSVSVGSKPTGISIKTNGGGNGHDHQVSDYLPPYQELFHIIRVK